MEEAGELLEASWFFENLLHTKSRSMSRCYSDLSSSSCPPLRSHPPLCSTQENVKNEQKNCSFSSKKQPPVNPPGLTRTPSLPNSTETQSFLTKKPIPGPNLMRVSSISTSIVGSDQEDHINVKKDRKSLSFSSRKQPPVASPGLTRTPSLPNSTKTQSFLTKKPNPGPNLMRASSMSTSKVGSDQEDHINVKKDRKSSSFSSRKQLPVAPRSLTRVPSLPTSIETQYFVTKKAIPSPCLTTSIDGSDQEDEDDQESEFTLGRLIRQASMNSSHTLNPSRQTAKAMTENLQKKPELDHKKIGDMGKMERNRSKSIKNSGKNKGGGGGCGAPPAIPGGLVDKSSSEDMKAHIKFWARAVASNVRQECS